MNNSYLVKNDLPEFKPLLGLTHPLLQTIVPYFIPYQLKFTNKQRLKISLPDNDALIVSISTPPTWKSSDKLVILVHGLAGSEDSTYLKRIGDRFFAKNINVVRVNLRSCGPGRGLAINPYHSGRSEDVRAVVQKISSIYPKSEIYLVGFSLSANITVKMLGEGVEDLKNFKGAVAVSPPLDLEKSANKIAKLSYGVFDRFFLLHLKKEVQKLKADFPNKINVSFPSKMNLIDFDNLYTAPRSGFKNALDYYQTCSGKNFISNIKTPLLLVYSIDDPVVESNCLDKSTLPTLVDLVETHHGGHIGFLSKEGFWMDKLITDWVVNH